MGPQLEAVQSHCAVLATAQASRGTKRHDGAEMRIVYRAENIIDAHLVKGALAAEGILAFVAGEYLTGAIGELPVNNLVAVMVADTDVERASAVAAAIDADLRERRQNPGEFDSHALPA